MLPLDEKSVDADIARRHGDNMNNQKTLLSFVLLGLFSCIAGMFGGCGQIPKTKVNSYDAVTNRIPPVAPGSSRVFVYSSDHAGGLLGGGIWYKFALDGQPIEPALPQSATFMPPWGTFLIIDHPAGNATITVGYPGGWAQPKPKDIVLNLESGETRYIHVTLAPHFGGAQFEYTLVDPGQAVEDLRKCVCFGTHPPMTTSPSK